MNTKNRVDNSSVLALTLCAAGFVGCGGPGLVKGSAEADNRSQGLQIGAVLDLNGSYEDGACMNPASGAPRMSASWSASVATPGAAPVVVLHDSGCVLNLASVAVQDSLSATQTASAAAPFALSASYLASPVLFSYTDSGTGQPVQFYGNAKLTPDDFSADFVLSLVYSDARDAATMVSKTGQYSTVVPTTVSDARVSAPNDSLSLASVSYMKDSLGIVTSVSGDPTFTLGATPGSYYVIADGTCPADLVSTDTAYQGGTQVSVNSAPLSGDFGLSVSADLTPALKKCMIVANCDAVMASVCSYQLFEMTLD
jgi:hypothetical protein